MIMTMVNIQPKIENLEILFSVSTRPIAGCGVGWVVVAGGAWGGGRGASGQSF